MAARISSQSTPARFSRRAHGHSLFQIVGARAVGLPGLAVRIVPQPQAHQVHPIALQELRRVLCRAASHSDRDTALGL